MTKYSDDDRISLFRSSFHSMANKPHWPQIRQHGRVDRLSAIQFRHIFNTCEVEVSAPKISDADADLLAANIRKFTSKQDPAYLPEVADAAARLGASGIFLDEARSQWEQIAGKRFPFIVVDGKSVGMRIAGIEGTIWWPGRRPDLPSDTPLRSADVSLLDFADVYFNETLLHTFEPKRRENTRAIVREVPEGLRNNLARLAMGATVYSAGLLHQVTLELGEEWACGNECQEARIMAALRAAEAPNSGH